jgi:hypothetical protein
MPWKRSGVMRLNVGLEKTMDIISVGTGPEDASAARACVELRAIFKNVMRYHAGDSFPGNLC